MGLVRGGEWQGRQSQEHRQQAGSGGPGRGSVTMYGFCCPSYWAVKGAKGETCSEDRRGLVCQLLLVAHARNHTGHFRLLCAGIAWLSMAELPCWVVQSAPAVVVKWDASVAMLDPFLYSSWFGRSVSFPKVSSLLCLTAVMFMVPFTSIQEASVLLSSWQHGRLLW